MISLIQAVCFIGGLLTVMVLISGAILIFLAKYEDVESLSATMDSVFVLALIFCVVGMATTLIQNPTLGELFGL